jgi:hypothetical protein
MHLEGRRIEGPFGAVLLQPFLDPVDLKGAIVPGKYISHEHPQLERNSGQKRVYRPMSLSRNLQQG